MKYDAPKNIVVMCVKDSMHSNRGTKVIAFTDMKKRQGLEKGLWL